MIQTQLRRVLPDPKMVLPAEFLIKMALVYALWRLFKYGGEHYENFLWGGWDAYKNLQGNLIAFLSAAHLRLMGYGVTQYERMIVIDGTRGIYVGDLCLGIAPMVIFTGFILVFGDHTQNKIWFIPLGLLIISVINVMRTSALALVQLHYPRFFSLAHENVYLYVTYGAIFLLLIWWMNKLAFKEAPEATA